jgi:hypothetical protein
MNAQLEQIIRNAAVELQQALNMEIQDNVVHALTNLVEFAKANAKLKARRASERKAKKLQAQKKASRKLAPKRR